MEQKNKYRVKWEAYMANGLNDFDAFWRVIRDFEAEGEILPFKTMGEFEIWEQKQAGK